MSYPNVTFLAHFDGDTANNGTKHDLDVDPGASIRPASTQGDTGVVQEGAKAGFGSAMDTRFGSGGTFFYMAQNGDLSKIAPTKKGTMELWVSPSINGSTDGTLAMFANGLTTSEFTNTNMGIMLAGHKDNQVWFNYRGQELTGPLGDVSQWEAASWHHLAITWDLGTLGVNGDGEVVLFVDGVKVDREPALTEPDPGTAWEELLWLGRLGHGNQFSGLLDELVIYNDVIYTGNFTPTMLPVGTVSYFDGFRLEAARHIMALTAIVPEPTTLTLLYLSGTVSLDRRSRRSRTGSRR